jgi:Common central domain of tyrosinase
MALGDGIRRNILNISKEEQDLFVAAIRQLDDPTSIYVYPNNTGHEGADASGNITYWDMMEQIHKDGHVHGLDVHGGPAFIPWHRAIVNHFEELLRKVDPRLSLHYWDWTTDPRVVNANNVSILGPLGFMGSASGNSAGIPFQDFESTEGGGHNFIWRNLAAGAPPIPSDATLLTSTDFTDFENNVHPVHDSIHSTYLRGTIGGSHFSFHDPFVFLLHANLDRLWATWQRAVGHPERLDTTIDPTTGTSRAYGNILSDTGNPSNYFDELVMPWAGVTGIHTTDLEPWNSDVSSRINVSYKDPSIIIPGSYDTAPHSSYIVTERDHFSTYELQTTLVYPQAFQVIYDGFTPDEIGLPGAVSPTISFLNTPTTGVIGTIGVVSPPVVVAENLAAHATPQRITFTFDIQFTNNGAFPVTPIETRDIFLKATLAGQTDIATIRLTNQPNPYMIDVQGGNPSWLSTDVRVFQLKTNEQIPGSGIVLGDANANGNAPYDYIQGFLGELRSHSNTSSAPLFDNISQNEQTSQLELSRTVAGVRVMNFAVAKVRYRASAVNANDVRVFFRSFSTMVSALDYNVNTNYRRRADGNIPLTGFIGSDVASIPYFAQARTNGSSQVDNVNQQTINATGGESYMYFGCWLDFNQDASHVVEVSGGLTSPIINLVRGLHQCLVAEIRFQPGAADPIIAGSTPASSDHLAQRNLAIVESDNPGLPSTHVVQHTILVKPSDVTKHEVGFNAARAVVVDKKESYDELVIRWNNLPRNTVATLFFPEWNVDEVLQVASTLRQAPHLLKKIDINTLECTITDIAYIPVPGGNIKPYAGLITLQLPTTVKDGQIFTVDVQQHSGLNIQRVFNEKSDVNDTTGKKDRQGKEQIFSISKRKVLGALRITIPVKMGIGLLKKEVRNLAVLRYIAQSIPENDRWHPIFVKYIGQIAEKVKGLGVDPTLIKPSIDDPGLPQKHEEKEKKCSSGKVCEVIYNCFGDFEGLVLETCEGRKHFKSCEKEIGEIGLRACKERLTVMICTDSHGKIEKIVVHCY